jgi:predicted extracellular nuclease/2',3'-cyclic-nucleotide 2'-phosphodiesterase (5'-nucleotidase family)
MALNLGDIAIVGYGADTSVKSFAFVVLTDVASDEVVNFTDNGWLSAGGFRSGEGTVTSTIPAGTTAGTVITVTGLTSTLNPSTSGDQIIAYQGSASSPNFLFAIDFADGNATFAGDATNSNTSAVPTGLAFGTNALAFELDNGAYTGSLSGSKAEILTNIANAANWTLNDTAGVTYPASFTILSGGTGTVAINVVSVLEGDSGTSALTFTVTRSDNASAFSVDYATANGTANAGADYVSTAGTLSFAAGGPLTQTITVTINGDVTAEPDETLTVTLSNLVNVTGTTVISNASGTGTIVNDEVTITRIHDIQGNAANQTANAVGSYDNVDGSPLKGQVVTVEAIVVGDFQNGDSDTKRDLNGFYLQETAANSDGDATTSEGIFVFANGFGPDVKVGDLVRVTGTVSEYFGQTQISSITAVTVVQDGTVADISTMAVDVNLPAADVSRAQDGDYQPDLEAYEGMLVKIPQTLTVTEQFNLDRFNEIKLVAGERPAQYTQENTPSTAGLDAHLQELGARTITYDDGLNVQNAAIGNLDGFAGYDTASAVRMGDTVQNLTGVLDYQWGGNSSSSSTWRVRSVEDGTNSFQDSATPREASPPDVGGNIKIASFNVLNYFTTLAASGATIPNGLEPRGANSLEELARQTEKLIETIVSLGADVLGLTELENYFTDNHPANALDYLVDQLNAVTGGIYAWVNPGVAEVGSDAISVGFIYNTSKVKIADGTTVETLNDQDAPAAALLSQSSIGAIFDGASTSRNPLAVTWEDLSTGELFTTVENHFKSKGSAPSSGIDADKLDGAGAWNNQRVLAAEALLDWLATDPTGTTDDDYIIMGDLNAYAKEDPIQYLISNGFTDISASFSGGDSYSYVFDGQVGTLDYIFVSSSLLEYVTGAGEWHINSDEADALDYNLDFSRDASIFDAAVPYRTSDHDPLIVGLSLGTPEPDQPVRMTDYTGPIYSGSETPTNALAITEVGHLGGLAGAEISAYDKLSERLYVTSGAGLQIIDLSDPANPAFVRTITNAELGITGGITSVSVRDGVIAIAATDAVKTDPGKVVLFNVSSSALVGINATVTVGANPDMLTFTPDGSKILVANEGEIASATVDAKGSVSIIDISGGVNNPAVITAGFEAFDGQENTLRASGVRIFEGRSVSDDVEPEYIAVSSDGTKAMVTLQEANAVAILDLATNTFTSIVPLGSKDFTALQADFVDGDGVPGLTTGNPVSGMFMPDAIASYTSGGTTYFITANEGDDRNDFLSPAETIRINSSSYDLNDATFPDEAALKANTEIGRLAVSNAPLLNGDTDGDGDIDDILMYGTRSFSILDENGNIIFDSGDIIERIVSSQFAGQWDDDRSDAKGPEPEGVTVSIIGGRAYAFVGLERSDMALVFDVTDPGNVTYTTAALHPGDDAPEGLITIAAADSPTGAPLLIMSNENSNTITIYGVENMALSAGSIAFVGFNSDGNDNLAFIALEDIAAGQTITFEDNEWNGSSWNDTNENALIWTATAAVTAGTIVTLDSLGTGTATASTGSIVAGDSATYGSNRGIGNSGETIYAYQGTRAAPVFLTAVTNNGFAGTAGVLTNTGLTEGVNALNLGSIDADGDIFAYTGTREFESWDDARTAINSATPSDWAAQDASGDQSADTVAPDVPFATTAFTVEPPVPNFTLQLLHFSDGEAGLLASTTAPNLAALVDAFDDDYANTLILSGGDNFLPGPFLNAGIDPSVIAVVGRGDNLGAADIEIHNRIGVEASTIGNHEFDLGTREFNDAVVDSQFPYLSSNLDFSGDGNISGRYTETVGVNALEEASSLKGRIVPSAVVTKGGEQIGLVGVTTQILESISSTGGVEVKGFAGDGSETNDMAQLAALLQPVINDLISQGVNKIVLMAHLQQIQFEEALAPLLTGVDIILAAGSNTRLGDTDDEAASFVGHAADFADTYPIITAGADGKTTVIVNTDNEYTYLGRLVVEFDANGEIDMDALTASVSINGAYAATTENVAEAWGDSDGDLSDTAFAEGTKGEQVADITEAVQAVIDSKDGNVYGYSNVYLEGERNLVRNQETNLGNLSSDANKWAGEEALGEGDHFVVALKNGGGIRSAIGAVDFVTGDKTAPIANPSAGKAEGGVSQLDVENSLRFNNILMMFDTTAEGLKAILEHGVAVLGNQGRFPQIGGVSFAFDKDLPAGSRITSMALIDENGNIVARLYEDGGFSDNLPAKISVVTLNFLAGNTTAPNGNETGGDGYPIRANGENFRYLLADGTLSAAVNETSNFTDATVIANAVGSTGVMGEQRAFELFMESNYTTPEAAYDKADTDIANDTRIQNLDFRTDTVLEGKTIDGTPGDDPLVGTAGDDTINGLAGNDTITATAGNDSIDGGEGTDTLVIDAAAIASLSDMTLTSVETAELVNFSTDDAVAAADALQPLFDAGFATVTWTEDGETFSATRTNGKVTVTDSSGAKAAEAVTGGPANAFETIVTEYENGKVTEQTIAWNDGAVQTKTYNDDGKVTESTIDRGGYTNAFTFDPATGKTTSQTTTDVNDVFSFQSSTLTFDANGKVAGKVTLDDDGNTTTETYVNGIIQSRVTVDGDGGTESPWSSITTTFDAAGAFASVYHQYDNMTGIVQGAAGSQMIEGHADYADALIGKAGDDVFVFTGGADRVLDFADVDGGENDLLDLTAFGVTSMTDLDGLYSQAGSDVVINFGNGDTLTLKNYTVDKLGNDDLFAVVI